MIEIVPFKAEHLDQMKVQERQKGVLEFVSKDGLRTLEQFNSWSGMVGERCVAFAGVIPYGDGRGLAWAYLAEDVGKEFIGVTKAIKRYLDLVDYRRIEMAVDCQHEQAHRWAKMLGFVKECDRMKNYTVDGRDCALYARVK